MVYHASYPSMEYGVLKTYFVGGHLIYVISTRHQEGVWGATTINPLSSLRYVFKNAICQLQDSAYVSFSKTKSLSNSCINCWNEKKSSATFLNFVTKTYQELVRREEQLSNRTSTLHIFCCLDVAVMEDCGELGYFVSGLGRSHGTHLYSSCAHNADNLAVSMADALGAYVVCRWKW